MTIQGNTLVENGVLDNTDNGHGGIQLLVGSTNYPSFGDVVADNYSYMLPTMDGTNFQLGWASDVADQDMVFTNNYIVGGYVNRDKMWQSMRVSGNTFYTNNSLPLQDLEPRGGFSTSSYNWNNNSYYGGSSNPFIYNGQLMSLSGWRSATGLDQNSTFTSGRPTGVSVFVRPNQYE